MEEPKTDDATQDATTAPVADAGMSTDAPAEGAAPVAPAAEGTEEHTEETPAA